jgi:hypothetical protein
MHADGPPIRIEPGQHAPSRCLPVELGGALLRPLRSSTAEPTLRSVIPLFAELARHDVHFLDHRRLGQELVGSLHQRRSDRPSDMGLTSRLVGENVEDAERRWTHPDREPCCRGLLPLGKRQRPFEEACDLFLLRGLASSRARIPTVTIAPSWSASSANVPFRGDLKG